MKELRKAVANRKMCIGCKLCNPEEAPCPAGAIGYNSVGKVIINEKSCTGCSLCEKRGPKGIISMQLIHALNQETLKANFANFTKGKNTSMKDLLTKDACDLHTHSFNSDGTYSPTELINEAEKIGLYAIALTDHNTIAGLPEFLKAAEGKQVKAIPGVEFSTDYQNKELHIIALFVSVSYYEKINELTYELLERKDKSYKELCHSLSDDGIYVDYEKIKSEAHGMPNRAHIAEALTKAGYTKSIKDAFNTLVSKDGKYYKEPTKLDAFETIRFIKSIGAVAVLAHPIISIDEGLLREFLPQAKEAGLDAMETIYHAYAPEQTKLAKRIAEQYGILESGGSDFHGGRRPNVSLGVGEGELFVDKKIAVQLEKRINKAKI